METLITESDRLMRENGFDLIDEYSKAVELAGFDTDATVLDIATGTGRMSYVLAGRGFEVWSGDINEETLERAAQRLGDLAGKVKLYTFDAIKTPFAENSFSSITCANAIHEMEDPDAVICEMTRLVKEDGKLMVIEFNDRGYEVIAKIHREMGRPEHRRGSMPTEEIDKRLSNLFESVTRSSIGLNYAWVAAKKRI